jgi:hypothetical protein
MSLKKQKRKIKETQMRTSRISARFGAVGSAFFCLAGFLIAAQTLHLSLEWRPALSGYTEKMDYFARNADRFDSVFLGSSRIRAHIAPTLFDETLSEIGIKSRSFNLGINALSLIELNSIADEVIQAKPRKLKRAFIEPVFGTDMPWKNVTTRRSIYFHNLSNTMQEIRCNIDSRAGIGGNSRNAISFGYHYVNVGRLTREHDAHIDNAHWTFSRKSLERAGGFREQGAIDSPAMTWWHEEFVNNTAQYRDQLERDLIIPENPDFQLSCQYDVMRDIASRFRDAGIQPVFLITPAHAHARSLRLFTEYLKVKGDPTPVLSYLDTSSVFYESGIWYDPRHLTAEGATLFTRRMAHDASRLLNLESPSLLASGR